MPYATAIEIASEFKSTTFGATGAVTDTELDEWCEHFSRMLDTYLVKKYEVPITGAAALSTVGLIVRSLVAARVARILNATQGIGESEANRAFALEKMAYKWLKDFKDGCIELGGATQKSRLDPKSFNQVNAIEPTWHSGVDEW